MVPLLKVVPKVGATFIAWRFIIMGAGGVLYTLFLLIPLSRITNIHPYKGKVIEDINFQSAITFKASLPHPHLKKFPSSLSGEDKRAKTM